MKVDLAIHAKLLVSPMAKDYFIKESQVVLVNAGEIVDVRPHSGNWKNSAMKCLDLSHHLVCPGFVNAHTHLAMTLFRGLAEDMSFNEWLNDYILPIERELVDKKFVRVGTRLAAWECIQQGITCVNDMYYFTSDVLDVLDECGLRGLVNQTFMSFPTPDSPRGQENAWKILKSNTKKFLSHPRLKPAVGPHAPYTCDDSLLKECRKFANDHGLHLHIHVSETKGEVQGSIKTFGKTPLKRLFDLGLLDGSTSLAHGVHLTDEDLPLISQKLCGLVHNPESNMKIQAGVCSVQKILGQRISVGLGTDGAASNNNLNMLQEMDTGAKLQKISDQPVSSKDILRMATLGGAQALGLDSQIGSIEVGKRADIIALDLTLPHMMPLHDPVSQLVYSATGAEITHTICDGKILMSNRKMTTLNTAAISKEVDHYHNKISKFLKKRERSLGSPQK